jgi:hypothetical protein
LLIEDYGTIEEKDQAKTEAFKIIRQWIINKYVLKTKGPTFKWNATKESICHSAPKGYLQNTSNNRGQELNLEATLDQYHMMSCFFLSTKMALFPNYPATTAMEIRLAFSSLFDIFAVCVVRKTDDVGAFCLPPVGADEPYLDHYVLWMYVTTFDNDLNETMISSIVPEYWDDDLTRFNQAKLRIIFRRMASQLTFPNVIPSEVQQTLYLGSFCRYSLEIWLLLIGANRERQEIQAKKKAAKLKKGTNKKDCEPILPVYYDLYM